MITIEFQPWRPFLARKKPQEVKRWLKAVGEASEAAFKGGMGNFPPASAPGAYPNVRSGRLRKSIRHVVTGDSVTIGSNMFYSIFLRKGTSKMARRKMSDSALKEGMQKARLGRWVEWSRAA